MLLDMFVRFEMFMVFKGFKLDVDFLVFEDFDFIEKLA